MPDPEDLAREEIDRQLEVAGWVVQDRDRLNPYAYRLIKHAKARRIGLTPPGPTHQLTTPVRPRAAWRSPLGNSHSRGRFTTRRLWKHSPNPRSQETHC